MVWTQFHDMHSGGGQKLKWARIYIEAPEKEAEIIFQNRFGRNPNRVTCTCCGPDYSLTESDTLEQATGFERGCAYAYVDSKGREYTEDEAWVSGKGIVLKGVKGRYVERQATKFTMGGKYRTVEQYLTDKSVLVIRKKDIKATERKGDLREEGYVWAGS